MRHHVHAYLHQLMPVLDGLAWIPQHGRPVLPPRAVGIAAHATHPDYLVMTDADRRRGGEEWGLSEIEEGRREGEREEIA